MRKGPGRRSVVACSVSAALLALVLTPGGAWAGPNEDRARERTKQGTSLYNLGRYDEAAAAYEDAYTAVPDPALLYNIGQAHRMAGRPEKALTAYKSYLRSTPPNAPARAQVEERVSELEKLLAEQRRNQAAPPTAPAPQQAGYGAPPPAAPPPPVPPDDQPYNDGAQRPWFIGVGAVGGTLRADCDKCSTTMAAGGGEIHGGYFLRPRLALIVDGWDMVFNAVFLQVHQVVVVAGAQWWAGEKLWLRGGLGFASAGYAWSGIFDSRKDETQNRPGLMVGAGYDFYRYQRFVFDLELRYGTGYYNGKMQDGYVVRAHSGGLGVAVTWY